MKTANAQKTFFIADVHLCPDDRCKRSLMLDFLDMVRLKAGDLYILGDFFEFWANNSAVLKQNRDVLNRLLDLTARGSKAGFLFGNRDFLINRRSLAAFGVDFLGEETTIVLDSKKLFLCHGHTLCLSDVGFLSYKRRIWPMFRLFDKFIPGPVENFIAKKCILKSKQVIQAQKPGHLDFTRSEIDRLFNSGMDAVICGHAHRPEQRISGTHNFYALPAWEIDKGYYLQLEDGHFSMHEFSNTGSREMSKGL